MENLQKQIEIETPQPVVEEVKQPIETFINREISWLAFNDRVIEQSMRTTFSFHKRMSFLGIASHNLDEFISVRFAGIYNQKLEIDTQVVTKEYKKILHRIKEQKNYINKSLETLVNSNETDIKQRLIRHPFKYEDKAIQRYFQRELYPILTPILLGNNKEVPKFDGDDVNFFIKLRDEETHKVSYVFLQIPHQVDRTVRLGKKYYLIDDIILSHIDSIFNNSTVEQTIAFKVTKEYDTEIENNTQISIIDRVNDVLIKREENNIIFLDIDTFGEDNEDIDAIIKKLSKLLHVNKYHIHVNNSSSQSFSVLGQQYLMKEPYKKVVEQKPPRMIALEPKLPSELDSVDSIFDYLDDDDLLIHHPYHTYDVVVGFLQEAANDPNVISIKQTLYRVSSEKSPIIKALCSAAMSGKKVTVMLELLARFDERQNIRLINTLNQAGCNIVYSLEGLKTHGKMCIVTKNTKKGIVTYSHVGTGNYNEKTAKIYTDISYFTSSRIIGKELTDVFNMITGFSKPMELVRVKYSPDTLRLGIMDEFKRCCEASTEEHPSEITIKVNSFSDQDMVAFMQDTMKANPTAKVNIICRGICSIPTSTEYPNLTVKSIVGRFLEHSRIYSFTTNGKTRVYVSSADLLTRNLDKRIEIMVPITDKDCRKRIQFILDTLLADTINSYELHGVDYHKVENPIVVDSHNLFITAHR